MVEHASRSRITSNKLAIFPNNRRTNGSILERTDRHPDRRHLRQSRPRKRTITVNHTEISTSQILIISFPDTRFARTLRLWSHRVLRNYIAHLHRVVKVLVIGQLYFQSKPVIVVQLISIIIQDSLHYKLY